MSNTTSIFLAIVFFLTVSVPLHSADTLRVASYDLVDYDGLDTVQVFSTRMHSGTLGRSQLDPIERWYEMNQLNSSMFAAPLKSHHRLLAGPFYFHGADEPGYTVLVDTTRGAFFDPPGRSGQWFDNPDFAAVHTSSTRLTTGSPEGTALNARFDYLFASHSLDSGRYVAGSYHAFGNDGQHFNASIDQLPNAAVDDAIALALYRASLHLPVCAAFQFTADKTSSVEQDGPSLIGTMDLSVASPPRIKMYSPPASSRP